MGKERLYRFSCEECELVLIAEEVPNGWVRLLSTRSTSSSGGQGIRHHQDPPVVWTPIQSVPLPDDAHWCSPECMGAWVTARATEAVERAKTRGIRR